MCVDPQPQNTCQACARCCASCSLSSAGALRKNHGHVQAVRRCALAPITLVLCPLGRASRRGGGLLVSRGFNVGPMVHKQTRPTATREGPRLLAWCRWHPAARSCPAQPVAGAHRCQTGTQSGLLKSSACSSAQARSQSPGPCAASRTCEARRTMAAAQHDVSPRDQVMQAHAPLPQPPVFPSLAHNPPLPHSNRACYI